nr:LysR family transcriptional regulator [Rhizobium sp. Root1203]
MESNHVISLEKELGCALFIRSTRKVELTRAGETFYERCVRILSDVDLTTELTRAAGGSRIRQIRIGTVYPATMGMLPTFLAKIARKFPDVRIHISSGNTGDIIRSLESGQINLGFIRPVENIGCLRFCSIAHERYHLAVAHSNPLASREEITIDDLRDQKIIAFNRQNLSLFLAKIARKFPDVRIHISSGNTGDIIRSLESGQINLGFIRPVENIGCLRFCSIAHERYHLTIKGHVSGAVARVPS